MGIAAFIDETVFHQLLHRHHFYDKSTSSVGLVSDGIFHAFGWFAVAIGLALVADLRRREALTRPGLLGYDWTWNIIAVIFGPSAPSWCAPALSGCGCRPVGGARAALMAPMPMPAGHIPALPAWSPPRRPCSRSACTSWPPSGCSGAAMSGPLSGASTSPLAGPAWRRPRWRPCRAARSPATWPST
ncbi:hypothetical protein GCM10010515_42450 [Streptomyces fructofermentans]|uniref:DUF2243 domain-containing protein n=1 Tax=Streptomyces fructofermentans TaxID=152141 RepID=A0A918KR28_9ACTN|nr:hypothetical protein GCM10010515_42450 [Streptomyces fructofermentans]